MFLSTDGSHQCLTVSSDLLSIFKNWSRSAVLCMTLLGKIKNDTLYYAAKQSFMNGWSPSVAYERCCTKQRLFLCVKGGSVSSRGNQERRPCLARHSKTVDGKIDAMRKDMSEYAQVPATEDSHISRPASKRTHYLWKVYSFRHESASRYPQHSSICRVWCFLRSCYCKTFSLSSSNQISSTNFSLFPQKTIGNWDHSTEWCGSLD